ncbi:hypothetical protein B9N43_02470 [Denitratisoma sp. DHT3]|uniref:dimethyl sulfoxide reductase anchor subunit n=1 Tax=Denitratisoma sp. DHT3 TaxID=1981880 RepID=UPI001198A814|nr:dimethyl sulfoxide reductase anchor subunit [Denitratisoma sp. DHT3]QDX80224.1 hypothetical protein B9N43_02470 [Denitratisoma sp. DHT3]
MTNTGNNRLVGNSFKLGYRFQRYWDTSMAIAFFSAEVGTGLFLVSYFCNYVLGMALGLALTATLKPYFHLAHMGVPQKSWRAILRPDRSWISRGAFAVAVLVGFGVLHVIDRATGLGAALGLSQGVIDLVGYLAVAGALVVMCYQGLAMSHSESLTLWASPLLPVSSFCYALTAGALLTLVVGWGALEPRRLAGLVNLAVLMLILDTLVVFGILLSARRKSKGGAFSAEMLLQGEYSSPFRNLVLLLGLAAPVVLMALGAGSYPMVILATLAMLVGFFAFRVLLFKAAVFEPITHDLAGSIGLPSAR